MPSIVASLGRLVRSLLVAALLLVPAAVQAQVMTLAATARPMAADRIALVIGNGAYVNVAPLPNAANDARSVADALRPLGFDVLLAIDANRRAMEDAIDTFMRRTDAGAEALFYFAGHGVEDGGANFLLPTDMPNLSPDDARRLRREAVNVTHLLIDLESRRPRVTIAVLDACRENPFRLAGARSLGARRGLDIATAAPEGAFVLYSAGTNQIALDSLGPDDPVENGVFTRHFVAALRGEGMELRTLARTVRRTVRQTAAAAGEQQTPSYYDQLIGDFYFAPPPAQPAAPDTSPSALMWASIADTTERSVLEWFVSAFGDSPEADQARTRLAALAPRAKRSRASGPTPPAEHACDRLAAFPGDHPTLPGKFLNEIDADAAQRVCTAAVRAYHSEPRFQAQLGRALLAAGKDVEAVSQLQRAADAGYIGGMVTLGFMLSEGRGAPRDAAEAVQWYRRAAEAGNAYGMVNLAVMLGSGRGTEKDEVEAVRWYRRAADAGNAHGMTYLAVMLVSGRGTEKDEAEAVRWYRRAAEAEQTVAMHALARHLADGRGTVKDEAEAVRWYRRAAHAGNAHLMYDLAMMTSGGRGTAKDPFAAARWLRRAANAGLAIAMNQLGSAYEEGRGVTSDLGRAIRWYERAVAAGETSQAPGNLKRARELRARRK